MITFQIKTNSKSYIREHWHLIKNIVTAIAYGKIAHIQAVFLKKMFFF